jgi:hypothetical protein
MPDPPGLNAINSRILTHADRLFEALEDLEVAGGMPALAKVMKPSTVERTVKVLKSARASIDAQLAAMKVGRKPR